MAKIFVGNFSFAINDEKLREYFAQIGEVTNAHVMTEGPGGRSRGFGFVEMPNEAEAKEAIKQLDGSTWDGRVVKVSEDRNNGRSGGKSQDNQRSGRDNNHNGRNPQQKNTPIGYFRAQPLDLGLKKKQKLDPFIEDPKLVIDYKDSKMLGKFMSERGRMLPRRMTGLSAYHQRQVARAIKRAQHLALLPYVKN